MTITSHARGILIAGFAPASNSSSLAYTGRGRRGEAGSAPSVPRGTGGCLRVPMGSRWYLWAPCRVTLAAPWVSDRGGVERTYMGAACVSACTVAVGSGAGEPLEDQELGLVCCPPHPHPHDPSLFRIRSASLPFPSPSFSRSFSLSLALYPPPPSLSGTPSTPPLTPYPRPPPRALHIDLSLSPVDLSPRPNSWAPPLYFRGPHHCFLGPHPWLSWAPTISFLARSH